MAVSVNYGDIDPSTGVYGLYNDFYVIITRGEGVNFNLSYRIKCTVIDDTTKVFENDVVPINEVSIVNPVEFLKDAFFRTQVIGLNGNVLDDSATVDIANFGCNRIRIEVGESYSDDAETPATFRGYDTTKDITFYNGYENVSIANTSTEYANYLDPKWYDSSTVKLNHTILNRKQSVDIDDENKVFAPDVVNLDAGEFKIDAIRTISYNSSGTVVSDEIEPVTSPATLKGYKVFNLPKRSTQTTGLQREEYLFRYSRSGETSRFSERISVTAYECNQNDRYRLRWFNRYGAFEYLNVNGILETENRYTRGKEILTDGVDLTATDFGKIKSVARPELKQTGTTKEISYTLNTNYITQEESEGLVEMLDSPNVIMYDPNNNIIPIFPEDSSIKPLDSKNGLISYSVRVKAANNGKSLRQ